LSGELAQDPKEVSNMAQSIAALAATDPEPDEPDPSEAALQLVADKINAVLDNGDFVPQREAQRILREMTKNHSMEHLAFLDAHAYRLYYEAVRDALQRRKRHVHDRAKKPCEAERKGEDLSIFVTWRLRVAEDDTQRTVGEMTGPDWAFSADESATEEKRAGRLRAFKRAVAKRCGDRKTSEVFTEDEFHEMYERLVR
jgi:hypothetical protein